MYDYRLEGRFKEAVITGDVSTVKLILKSGKLPENRLAYYFHIAAQRGNLEVVHSFLSTGAVDVNHVNVEYGKGGKVTALHESILHGHPSLVKFLLCAGADSRKDATFSFTRLNSFELARILRIPPKSDESYSGSFPVIIEDEDIVGSLGSNGFSGSLGSNFGSFKEDISEIDELAARYSANAKKRELISDILGRWNEFLADKVYRAITNLTRVYESVMVYDRKEDILSGIATNRTETLDEIVSFLILIHRRINFVQFHWKLVETLYDRAKILALIENCATCVDVLIEHFRFTENEVKIYESRLKPFVGEEATVSKLPPGSYIQQQQQQ